MLEIYKLWKKKWKIQSDFQMFIVVLVFAITGSASVFIAKPILTYFSITPEKQLPILIYWFLRIVIILPIYQLLLLIVGTVFGQYKFFIEFEKKMIHRLSGGLIFPKEKNDVNKQ